LCSSRRTPQVSEAAPQVTRGGGAGAGRSSCAAPAAAQGAAQRSADVCGKGAPAWHRQMLPVRLAPFVWSSSAGRRTPERTAGLQPLQDHADSSARRAARPSSALDPPSRHTPPAQPSRSLRTRCASTCSPPSTCSRPA
jgi:hypothetical protein